MFNASEKLWSGTPVPLLSKLSVGYGLLRAMKIAQINMDNGKEITFDEMYFKSVQAAHNIRECNCGKGEILPIIARNNHDDAPICMVLLCIGNPFYALHPDIGDIDYHQLLQMAKSKIIFCEMKSYAMVKRCGKVDDSFAVEDLFAETGIEGKFIPTEVEVENDVAAILQSSGTTGKMCAKKTFTFVGYHKNPERTLEVFEAGGFKYTGKQPLSGGIYLVKSIKMNVSGKMVHREMQKFVKNIYKKFKTRKFGMSRRSSYDFNLLLHK